MNTQRIDNLLRRQKLRLTLDIAIGALLASAAFTATLFVLS